jgi:hypothetical protein
MFGMPWYYTIKYFSLAVDKSKHQSYNVLLGFVAYNYTLYTAVLALSILFPCRTKILIFHLTSHYLHKNRLLSIMHVMKGESIPYTVSMSPLVWPKMYHQRSKGIFMKFSTSAIEVHCQKITLSVMTDQ